MGLIIRLVLIGSVVLPHLLHGRYSWIVPPIFFTLCIHSTHLVLDARPPASKGKQFLSSSDSEDDEDSKKKFKIKIKPLVSDSVMCVPPSMDELKASVGGLALSPSLVSSADLVLILFIKYTVTV